MTVSKIAYNNAINNLHECKKRSKHVKSYPLKLYIEPTTVCNLDCTYCYPRKYRENKEMKIELFQAIEKQLFAHCSEVNLFLRGEPTLASNFPQMLDICGKYQFITKFFSNLSYNNDAILEKMVENGIWLNVSFDGIDKVEEMRKGINLKLVLRNIKFLQSYQEKTGNKKFHLRIAVVISKTNVMDLVSIVEWAHSMNIKEVMYGCIDAGHMNFKDALAASDAVYFNNAVKRADELQIRISTPSHIGGEKLPKTTNWSDFKLDVDEYFPHFCEDSNPDVEKRFCPYPWIQTVIDAEGEVISCCQRKIHIGKFSENTDFMKEIWNNKSYQKLRAQKDFTKCKNLLDHSCGLSRYSIWGGELRLNNIPKPIK